MTINSNSNQVSIPLAGRRSVLTALILTAALILAEKSVAASEIGKAVATRGKVDRRRQAAVERLTAGASLIDRDIVATGAQAFAELRLGRDTQVFLGEETELTIDRYIAGQGGTLELGTGRMLFDRPDAGKPVDVELRTAFGMIGVRGTKFFCGPSRGHFAVFVERGAVSVRNAGITRTVRDGEGVDIAAPDAAPSEPVSWGAARIREAYVSVGLP